MYQVIKFGVGNKKMFKNTKPYEVESFKLLPHSFPTLAKLPLLRKKISSTYLLVEVALQKIENNAEARS